MIKWISVSNKINFVLNLECVCGVFNVACMRIQSRARSHTHLLNRMSLENTRFNNAHTLAGSYAVTRFFVAVKS